jgi:hypothetical protein
VGSYNERKEILILGSFHSQLQDAEQRSAQRRFDFFDSLFFSCLDELTENVGNGEEVSNW